MDLKYDALLVQNQQQEVEIIQLRQEVENLTQANFDKQKRIKDLELDLKYKDYEKQGHIAEKTLRRSYQKKMEKSKIQIQDLEKENDNYSISLSSPPKL